MAPANSVSIAGVDPFKHGLEGVTYLGLEWVLNPIVRTDIDVVTLLASVGGDYYTERRDELVNVLDIDLTWRMHAVSDGERRRVQLAMGLLRPWTILLLDEITVDLDLLSRSNFLGFLKKETHLVHMSLGKVKKWGSIEDMGVKSDPDSRVLSGNSQLGELVLNWLQEDLDERGPRNGSKSQGKTYESLEGKGGYGAEKKFEE
jgi:CCR4-NOT complex subunit CAF16